jgi:hypothetical protein
LAKLPACGIIRFIEQWSGRCGMSASVSNYPQDFATADPASIEPVDSTLFLGVHPLLLLLLAALVLGLMILAWRAGKATAPTRGDAAESIWRAVDRACQAAMTANSDALPGAAKALRTTLNDRLGAVIALADGPARPLKAIDHALKGRLKEAAKPRDDHGHDHAAKPGHGDPARPDARPPAAVPANVTVVSNSHVVIKSDRVEHGPAHGAEVEVLDRPAPPHPPAPPPPPRPEEKEVERDMTRAEQLAALREAVAQFNDHWCRREERVRELHAAHRQLSTHSGGPLSGPLSGPVSGAAPH